MKDETHTCYENYSKMIKLKKIVKHIYIYYVIILKIVNVV